MSVERSTRRKDREPVTMKTIEEKSHWDGDCLIWDGATTHKAPYINVNRQSVNVRRWIAENVQGKAVKGYFVTFSCNCSLCVNPDHILVVTRKTLQKMHADRVGYSKNPARNKKLSEQRRKTSKYTLEDVKTVREWQGSQRELSRIKGWNFDWVNKVKQGRIWKDYNNPFSGLMR